MADSRRIVKLGLDERDDLKEVIESQGWLNLLKVIEGFVTRKGQDVLTLQEPSRLLTAKSEYDGQKELLANIKNLKKILAE
jgi:hypothetical protein